MDYKNSKYDKLSQQLKFACHKLIDTHITNEIRIIAIINLLFICLVGFCQQME